MSGWLARLFGSPSRDFMEGAEEGTRLAAEALRVAQPDPFVVDQVARVCYMLADKTRRAPWEISPGLEGPAVAP